MFHSTALAWFVAALTPAWSCDVRRAGLACSLALSGPRAGTGAENQKAAPTVFHPPSLPRFGSKPAHACSFTGEVQASHSSPVRPTGPPTGQGAHFPFVRTQGEGIQCWLNPLTPQIRSSPGHAPFSPWLPPRDTGSDLMTPLPSLPDSVCIFHKVFIVWESFSQSPVSF